VVIQQVAPGVWVATELIGANVGMVQTPLGAVLVDAPYVPSQARAWRAEVEQRSSQGVIYRVMTDYHLDHVLGSCFLPPALTIAHETAWKHLKALDRGTLVERILEQGQLSQVADIAAQLADVQIVLPEITIGSAMTLWCNGQPVEIIHFGGHTASTLGVHVPAEGILFAGDVVVAGCHPFVGDANSRQWIEALERIRRMDLRTIVPGHGQPSGPEIVTPLYDYLQELRARVLASFQAGHTRRETVERVKLLDSFPVPPRDEERLRKSLRAGVERVYDEVKKEAGRKP
jgi:cyclase